MNIMQDEFNTYIIPGHRIEEARHRIEKANKRLQRAGITEKFTYTETPTPQDVDGKKMEAYTLELSVPYISYQGWTFAAAVDILDNGTILRSPNGVNADNLPRPDSHNCDHCGVSRGRKYSYLLKNDNTGEIKQIGKSCLKLFLGVSPVGLWTLQWDDLSDLEIDLNDNDSWSFVPIMFTVDEVIRASMVVSDNGNKFISRARANERGIPSTSDTVADLLNPSSKGMFNMQQRESLMKDVQDINQDIIDEVMSAAETVAGNYGENLRAVLGNEYITGKHLGLLCSIVSVYHRNKAHQEKMKIQQEAPSGHIGEIGEKITNIPVTIINKMSFDGTWNVQTMLIMRADDTGHILKWVSASAPQEVGGVKVEIGTKLVIDRATVKKHAEYQGVSQTDIIRVKFSAQEEKEAA